MANRSRSAEYDTNSVMTWLDPSLDHLDFLSETRKVVGDGTVSLSVSDM